MRVPWPLIMFALGLAIPGFIIYSIFFATTPAPKVEPLPGFAHYKSDILARPTNGYEIADIIDESLVLRVNAVVEEVPSDRLAARVQATNILYDIQSVVGQEVSVSVWTYRAKPTNESNMIGLIYFHALTANQVFKTREELQ